MTARDMVVSERGQTRAVVKVWWPWLRPRAAALAAAVLAALLAAWVAGFAVHTVYLATATVQFAIPPATQVLDAGDPVNAAVEQAPNYARLVHTSPVLAGMLQQAGMAGDPAALAGGVVAQVVPNTNLIELQVYADDPAQAARLANALAAALIAYVAQSRQAQVDSALQNLQAQIAAQDASIADLTTQLAATPPGATQDSLRARLAGVTAQADQLRSTYAYYDSHSRVNTSQPLLRLVEPATPPAEPIASASWLTLLLVGAVALVLALAALWLLDLLDTRVRGAADLQAALGLPLLGTIPRRET